MKHRSKLGLYFDYFPLYNTIRKKDKLRNAMSNDPGYKWMNKVTWIIIIIIILFSIWGNTP